MGLGDNILRISKEKRISIPELATKTGVSKQMMYQYVKNQSAPGKEILDNICKILEVSEAEIRGLVVKDTGLKYNGVHLLVNEMEVPLVNQYAYAGYPSGYSDHEYINGLDRITWQVEREGRGNYMCFEVRGDSMDDGSRDSLLPGDIVLAREIQRHLWNGKFHMRRYKKFVIVHKTDGILIKEIKDHDLVNNTITIHSLNPEFEDQVLRLDDIAQIFNVVKRQINE